jgi:hypothetical protein
MGISNRKLYVTDIDRTITIDGSSGIITEEFHVKGAVFLNDISVGSDGPVFISDMSTNTIHEIKKGQLKMLFVPTFFDDRIVAYRFEF